MPKPHHFQHEQTLDAFQEQGQDAQVPLVAQRVPS